MGEGKRKKEKGSSVLKKSKSKAHLKAVTPRKERAAEEEKRGERKEERRKEKQRERERNRAQEGSSTDIASSNFDPQLMAHELFTTQDSDAIRSVVSDLQARKAAAGASIQAQVHSHYPQFISATRHIHRLEADVSALRQLFSQQQATVDRLLAASCDRDAASLFTSRISLLQGMAAAPDSSLSSSSSSLDALDALIADRRFTQAVEMVEKRRRKKRRAEGMESRVDALGELLLRVLERSSSAEEVREAIGLLVRLGRHDDALAAFLRTQRIEFSAALKSVTLEGDVVAYVAKVAAAAVACILAACKQFQRSFPDPTLLSAFVVWAMEALEEFAVIFRRHVAVCDEPSVAMECRAVAQEHCLPLENAGLLLSFHLEAALAL